MNKLYKLIGIMLVTIAFAMPVMAQNPYAIVFEYLGQHKSGIVLDHYKTVIQQTPYQVEICKRVNSTSGGATSGDVFIGAIIGGVIGNQVGKGKGNDAATILGAILGADIANKNKQGQTTTGTQCFLETRYTEASIKVYSHSTLNFEINGVQYKVDFVK